MRSQQFRQVQNLGRLTAGGLAFVAILALGLLAVAASEESGEKGVDPEAAFEELKKLAGHWEGTHTRKDGPPDAVSYRVTANGTILIEREHPGGEDEMVSVYHMDGDNLVRKHYCILGNQPEMKLDTANSTASTLRFVFTGATNLKSEDDLHVHEGEIRLVGQDALELAWAVYEGGEKMGTNAFFLSRKK